MDQILGYASGVLASLAYVPYVIEILRGKTKPERASWFIWSVLALSAFFSQFAKGATNSLWQTTFDSLGTFIILGLSFKYGVGGFKKRDIVALLIAVSGLVLWYVTKEPLLALVLVILIDPRA